MIMTASQLRLLCPEAVAVSDEILNIRLAAIENLIRSYTNNNFQNRNVRFSGGSMVDMVMGSSPYLKEGDTVQITESKVNDGLYVITDVVCGCIELDKVLYAVTHNLVTKVEYPPDVVQGAVLLMQWELQKMDRLGVKSETVSRHSVTYYDQDKDNQVMGYPVSLLGFLEPYKKARF